MTAPRPAPTMANVFDDDGRYLGCVFARGVAGFEAFSADDKSLGIVETQRRAANALLLEADATCPACGSQFRPQRSTARYCGPRCRKATQRARDRGAPLRVAATRPGVGVDAVLSVTTTPLPPASSRVMG
jgi:hypothetical protein